MKTQIKVYDHKGTFKGILDKQTYSSSFEVDCLKNGGQQTLELEVNNKENLIGYSDFIEVYANINGIYQLYYSGIVYRFPDISQTTKIYINGSYEFLTQELYYSGNYSGTVKDLIQNLLDYYQSKKITDNNGIFHNSTFTISDESEVGPSINIEVEELNCFDFIKKVCEIGKCNFYIGADRKILIRENPIQKVINYGIDFQDYKSEVSSDDIYNIVTIKGKNNTKTYENLESINQYGRIVGETQDKSEITDDTTLDNYGQKLINEESRKKREIEITHNFIGFKPGYSVSTLNLKENFVDLIVEKVVLKGTYEILYIDKYINYGKILGNQI